MGLVKKRDGRGFYTAAKTKVFKEPQGKKKACEELEVVGTIVGAGGTDAITEKEKDEAIKKILMNNRSRQEVPVDVSQGD